MMSWSIPRRDAETAAPTNTFGTLRWAWAHSITGFRVLLPLETPLLPSAPGCWINRSVAQWLSGSAVNGADKATSLTTPLAAVRRTSWREPASTGARSFTLFHVSLAVVQEVGHGRKASRPCLARSTPLARLLSQIPLPARSRQRLPQSRVNPGPGRVLPPSTRPPC